MQVLEDSIEVVQIYPLPSAEETEETEVGLHFKIAEPKRIKDITSQEFVNLCEGCPALNLQISKLKQFWYSLYEDVEATERVTVVWLEEDVFILPDPEFILNDYQNFATIATNPVQDFFDNLREIANDYKLTAADPSAHEYQDMNLLEHADYLEYLASLGELMWGISTRIPTTTEKRILYRHIFSNLGELENMQKHLGIDEPVYKENGKYVIYSVLPALCEFSKSYKPATLDEIGLLKAKNPLFSTKTINSILN